jgi:hypothetical protein
MKDLWAATAIFDPMSFRSRLENRRDCRQRLAELDTSPQPCGRRVNGPCPVFWSGLVRQGRLKEEALGFLARRKRRAPAVEFRRRAFAAR